MNPINVICESCGRDVLVEPEVMDDDEATCPMCHSTLFYDQFNCPYTEREKACCK